jgi:hypothetical protein
MRGTRRGKNYGLRIIVGAESEEGNNDETLCRTDGNTSKRPEVDAVEWSPLETKWMIL